MQQYVNNVYLNNGEGVMLRKPSSVYHNGKSASVLKVKVHNCFIVEVVLL